MGYVHERIGVLRFIKRQDYRPSHHARRGDERAGWYYCGVKKLLLQCDEPALGGAQIRDRLKGVGQRQLENFNSGSYFESARSQYFSAECCGLSIVGFRCRLDLRKSQRRRAGRDGVGLTSGQGTAGHEDYGAKDCSEEWAHRLNYNKAHTGSSSAIIVLA